AVGAVGIGWRFGIGPARAGAYTCIGIGPAKAGPYTCFGADEGVDHGDLRVGDRVGVVVTVDLPHVGLAAFEIEALHLIQAAFQQIYRLLVQRRRTARETRLADHVRTVRRVHHHEVVGRDRSQAHRIGR